MQRRRTLIPCTKYSIVRDMDTTRAPLLSNEVSKYITVERFFIPQLTDKENTHAHKYEYR